LVFTTRDVMVKGIALGARLTDGAAKTELAMMQRLYQFCVWIRP
jgi:hypothetical protein